MAEDQEPRNPVDSFEDDLIFSQCATCGRKWAGEGKCDAFPLAIPLTILTNETPHDRPYPGDLGLQWEAKAKGLRRGGEPLP